MDKETFGAMILDNKDSLYRVAKSILKDDEDCADAIGEAVAKGFEKLHRLKKDEYAKTWLIRILINECYNIHRRWQRFEPQNEKLESFEEDSCVNGSETEYPMLHAAIDQLEDKQRLIIDLYYIEEYSTNEIAKLMGMSVNNVKVNLSRARKKIKNYLEECVDG